MLSKDIYHQLQLYIKYIRPKFINLNFVSFKVVTRLSKMISILVKELELVKPLTNVVSVLVKELELFLY